MAENFSARLNARIKKKASRVVVGLDPQLERLPASVLTRARDRHGTTLRAVAAAYHEFCLQIMASVAEHAVAVKPQLACFEEYGSRGLEVLEALAQEAHSRGLIVIGDGKRNDIGHTARVYSRAYLGRPVFFGEKGRKNLYGFDALTVNPYPGSDGIEPFVRDCMEYGRGIFVLVKTSNPSAVELQDRILVEKGKKTREPERKAESRLYNRVAELVDAWNERTERDRWGYGAVGAVVGATYPEELEDLRSRLKSSIFLVPGYGAQGGGAEGILPAFDSSGHGAVVNSSRGIIYAVDRTPWCEEYEPAQYAQAAGAAAEKMKREINRVLSRSGK